MKRISLSTAELHVDLGGTVLRRSDSVVAERGTSGSDWRSVADIADAAAPLLDFECFVEYRESPVVFEFAVEECCPRFVGFRRKRATLKSRCWRSMTGRNTGPFAGCRKARWQTLTANYFRF